ncbi:MULTISPECIES: hypothetical protein [unclassified Rhizobium]|uniref:hypothetical protein n=1 Tax=unclassified Rhizobium TaxID=2613769 RepID=UPI0007EC1637|nr:MULTISPECIES: hypothetical protein [unclassified Rhizobium]ANL11955.1 hypothetical protein AMJ98_PA00009 [Rhizobium sp. N1341]ANM42800.1 hypothetical protein AMK03_PA00009 [Rhizobium sp. N741]
MALVINPQAISLTKFKKVKCTRCNGTGRVPKYKHIEDGKCFDCNGTRWVSVAIQPPPPLSEVPLFVTLQQVKDEWPQHDSFGHSIPSFRTSFEKLITAVGRRDDMAAAVSIGDVAKAFNPGTAVNLALKIPGVDRRTITRIVLPAAERAAAAIKEPGLGAITAAARKLIDTDEHVEPLYRALIRHHATHDDTPESYAKACGEALARIAGRGVVGSFDLKFECLWVVSHASSVIEGIARRENDDPAEAVRLEGERQMGDLYAVSPLHVFANGQTMT